MNSYDWIVVGAGLTGAAIAYELCRAGLTVLLLEPDQPLQGATRYSYGGISFWSGTTPLTQQLYQEGLTRHRQLSAELDYDTEFREIALLLTVAPDRAAADLAPAFARCSHPPQVLSAIEAFEQEPLLRRSGISGALCFSHAYVSPLAMVNGYLNAFERLGGQRQQDLVLELLRSSTSPHGVVGVKTRTAEWRSAHTLLCAGADCRRLAQQAGVAIRQYFTWAEVLETPPLDLQLRTLVMPAASQRLGMEVQATQPDREPLWDRPGQELAAPILDSGVVQFGDRHCCIGQISRAATEQTPLPSPAESERLLRQGIGAILPALAEVSATWHRCRVAFSADHLPLVGPVAQDKGLHLFTGFSSPFAMVPSLAQHFARWAAGQAEDRETVAWLAQLSPDRNMVRVS